MFDEKAKRELLNSLGASAAAASAAVSASVGAITSMLASDSKPAVRAKTDPRSPMTFKLPERLGEKQMLQLRVVPDTNGLRVVDPRISGNAESAAEFGARQDGGLNLAVVREGELLHVYGPNAFVGETTESGRCIIMAA